MKTSKSSYLSGDMCLKRSQLMSSFIEYCKKRKMSIVKANSSFILDFYQLIQ